MNGKKVRHKKCPYAPFKVEINFSLQLEQKYNEIAKKCLTRTAECDILYQVLRKAKHTAVDSRCRLTDVRTIAYRGRCDHEKIIYETSPLCLRTERFFI